MDIREKGGYRLAVWAIIAFALMLVTAGMGATKAFAADATGSITLTACTAPANANSSAILPGQVTPVAGDVFTLQKLSDSSDAANEDVKAVTIDSTPLASFATQTKTGGSDGVATFSNLTEGVYLVTQTPPAGYRAAETKFLVAVPMVDSTNAAGNWDVKVYPKLQTDKMIAKEVIDAPSVAGVGSAESWAIHVTIPQDMKYVDAYGNATYSTKWSIYDDFDAALDYAGADSTSSSYEATTLEVLDSSGTSLVTLVAGTDYTETYDATAHRATWNLTTAGIKKVADTSGGAQICVTVHTVVNEKAYDITTYIFNNAGYSYTDPNGDSHNGKVTPGTPDPNNPDDPHIAIGGLVIDKYLANTSTKLAGAHFKVARSKEDAAAAKFLTKTENGTATDIELVTDSNGAASLGGLASGTYYLVETTAPQAKDSSGNTVTCVILSQPVAVTVSSDATKNVITASVANNLPSASSGGSGSGGSNPIAETISGIADNVKTGDPLTWSVLIAIIAAAGAGCVIARRKSREDQQQHGRVDR